MERNYCKKCGGAKAPFSNELINEMLDTPTLLCMCGSAKVGKYKTFNLNEATYLVLKGFRYGLDATMMNASCFVFDDTEELEKARKEFWTSGCKVNIHTWIGLRQEIKNSLKSQVSLEISQPLLKRHKRIAQRAKNATEVDVNKPISTYTPNDGDAYWYASNGIVCHAIAGAHNMHKRRQQENNCFKTKEEAEIYLARRARNL